MSTLNGTTDGTLPDGVADTPQAESEFFTAIVVFLLPFIVIPISIILYRLIKYIYKVQQARKYGYGIRYLN